MPYVKVNIHFVWSTKDRKPFLSTAELRTMMWKHIKDNSVKKDIYIDVINGHSDHCHCLISLSKNQNISNIAQLLKGESAFWINKQQLCSSKFEWQDEYFAVSVSDSMLDSVRRYIMNQEEHHKVVSVEQEYRELLKRLGFC